MAESQASNNLSPQDIQDLQDIASRLPKGDARLVKIQMLLSSQPSPESQTPDANAQAKQTLQNIPQFTSPADQLRGQLANAQQNSPQYNDYMRQSGNVAATAAGGMIGGALAPATKGLPAAIRALSASSAIGLGAGAGALVNEPNKPKEALNTAAAGTATGMVLSPVAKFIQDLGAKAKAGPLFKAVSEAAGENPVDTSGPLAAAQQAKQLQNAGFQMPRVISRFIARMNTGEPLTFDEARLFEQAAGGRLSPAEASRMTPAMYRQLSQFADEMRKSTMQAAGQSGQANTFSDAINMYRTGAQAEQKHEIAKEAMIELIKMAGKGAAYGAGAGGAYQAGKALLGGKK